ncbi:MAG: hypothetical protein ABIG84_01620 [archaeon]
MIIHEDDGSNRLWELKSEVHRMLDEYGIHFNEIEEKCMKKSSSGITDCVLKYISGKLDSKNFASPADCINELTLRVCNKKYGLNGDDGANYQPVHDIIRFKMNKLMGYRN